MDLRLTYTSTSILNTMVYIFEVVVTNVSGAVVHENTDFCSFYKVDMMSSPWLYSAHTY